MSLRSWLKSSILLCFLPIVLCGCGDGDGSVGGSANIRRPPPSSPPPEDPPPVEVEPESFSIDVGEVLLTAHINNQDGWGNACEINSDETTSQDMDCFVDVLEGSIYARDLNLIATAPGSMCDHMTITPPWHWNFSPGIGPKEIILDFDDENNLTNCQARDENDTLESCADNIETIPNGDQPLCVYDHSRGNTVSQPNCCFGQYTKTINRDTTGDGSTDTTEEIQALWNDPANVRTCIGGPAMVASNWSSWNSAGYPRGRLFSTENTQGELGITETINMRANMTSVFSNFSYQANFFTSTGAPHAHGSHETPGTDVTDLPYALNPVDDLDFSPFGTLTRGVNLQVGRPAWEVSCLDAGFEIKHRINVYVREWNTLTDFIAYEQSEGVDYDPDVDGTAGVDCDYDSSFGGTCNDFLDLDDLLPGSGYDLTRDPEIRKAYFPSID